MKGLNGPGRRRASVRHSPGDGEERLADRVGIEAFRERPARWSRSPSADSGRSRPARHSLLQEFAGSDGAPHLRHRRRDARRSVDMRASCPHTSSVGPAEWPGMRERRRLRCDYLGLAGVPGSVWGRTARAAPPAEVGEDTVDLVAIQDAPD